MGFSFFIPLKPHQWAIVRCDTMDWAEMQGGLDHGIWNKEPQNVEVRFSVIYMVERSDPTL